jgi:hypothetical protein
LKATWNTETTVSLDFELRSTSGRNRWVKSEVRCLHFYWSSWPRCELRLDRIITLSFPASCPRPPATMRLWAWLVAPGKGIRDGRPVLAGLRQAETMHLGVFVQLWEWYGMTFSLFGCQLAPIWGMSWSC